MILYERFPELRWQNSTRCSDSILYFTRIQAKRIVRKHKPNCIREPYQSLQVVQKSLRKWAEESILSQQILLKSCKLSNVCLKLRSRYNLLWYILTAKLPLHFMSTTNVKRDIKNTLNQFSTSKTTTRWTSQREEKPPNNKPWVYISAYGEAYTKSGWWIYCFGGLQGSTC